jgi:hypothetical protein
MSRVIIAMLAMTGRVTMLGLARWAGAGGSYRTIQRFYYTAIPWAQVFWQFFVQPLFRKAEVYILAGDESVVSIVKMNLATQAHAHVILFSSDLELSWDTPGGSIITA